MKYSNLKKIVVLGIGGKGAYYIVKFLRLLDIQIKGYDLKSNDRTVDLESLGVDIEYRNPDEGEKFVSDMYIYSNDLPRNLQEKVKEDNNDIPSLELGKFYHQIITDYEEGNLSEKEVKAFKESDIAPLFNIDTTKMKYIAVTGTDGKTTTCTMIYHLLKEAGFKPALITTVAAYIGDRKVDTGLHTTTPSSQELYSLIQEIEKEGCTHLIIEATSHGLEQGRLAGLKFDTVGYTNITSEHLDYHGDWYSYCNAKSLLIRNHLKEDGNIVLNSDDKSFDILSKISEKYITYSLALNANFEGKEISEKDDSISFTLSHDGRDFSVKLNILGRYNVSNSLCALAICSFEEIELVDLIKGMETFKTVEGRMEVLQKEPYTVIVDYAHTSNAVENALKSAKLLVKEGSKLIHVFGCAGRRDFYKRPEMGKISNELADISILTAEDPRLEDLKVINDEIEKGWRDGKNKDALLLRFDYMDKDVQVRRDAIIKALELASDGDVVIITGKAHENSLCFGQTEYPWNDIVETRKLL